MTTGRKLDALVSAQQERQDILIRRLRGATGTLVEDFGAAGDGANDDTTAFQIAVDSGATAIYLTPGKRYLVDAADITIPTTVEFFGCPNGTATMVDAGLVFEGTAGPEVELTASVAIGADTLPFATAGFAAGDLIYVMSCVNALSADAGDDQLAWPTGSSDGAYFAEFLLIHSIDSATQATVSGAAVFPYSDTPGAESGARTASTVRKVTLHGLKTIEGIAFEGKRGSNLISSLWAQAWIERCYWQFPSVATGQFYEPVNGYGGGVCGNCKIVRAPWDSAFMSGSSWNSVSALGCQNFTVKDSDWSGGGQVIDFTYQAANLPDAAVCVDFKALYNEFAHCNEGVTTHGGCYRGSISHNNVSYCDRGLRIRSKETLAANNTIQNMDAIGIGIYASGGFLTGTLVKGNIVIGFLQGITVDGDSAGEVPPIPGRCTIQDNTVFGATTGIYVTRTEPSALLMNVFILDNTVLNFASKGIDIDPYCNGTVIDGNIVADAQASADRGISWDKNIVDLTVSNNKLINLGTANSLRGPSATVFIDDLTTFPLGNAEARLAIFNNVEIGATGGTVSLIRVAAAYSTTVFNRGQWRIDGKLVAKQIPTITGNVFELQDSSANVDFALDQAGKMLGTNPAAAKAAIAAAADVAALKTALAILFQ